MDPTIKEVYEFSLRSQEGELDLVKNRVEFINWLFGVASALIFSSVIAARTIIFDPCPAIMSEKHLIQLIGLFSFFAILFSFIGKWQGYNSIGNIKGIITLLDVQKCAFLKDTPPSDSNDKKMDKFSKFQYLPDKLLEKYDHYLKYSGRKYSEILWLKLTSAGVLMSLTSMLVLLAELTI